MDLLLEVDRPGSSLAQLIGALSEEPQLPTDLAELHDSYLYPPSQVE